jgi:putative phosphoesterase
MNGKRTSEGETLALFSDVHGNRRALEAVLEELEGRGIGRMYCLGDLVGYGADPSGVVELVRAREIPCLLGNYDEGVGWETGDCGCFFPDDEARRIGDASYAFTVAATSPEDKAFLRTLPRERHVTIGATKVHLVHGSPRRINEYLQRDRDERTYLRLAAEETDDILAFGHTHEPWWREFGGKLFVNVGSVGRPKDGDPRAMYVTIRRTSAGRIEVEVRRVAYDVEGAARAVIEAGLPAELADAIRRGR